ncbi:MAG: xanthine dehydrogenase small subunit [Pseudomonadota bacterium]|nr:xanthine dehydrogenase small subunit [Pseudomonadota bacterium]
MASSLRFVRKNRTVELHDVAPCATLLDYLRLNERATGTKEGCAEGDCGACTVAIGSLAGDKVRYQPVNSCILLLGQIDGKEVVVVDDLEECEGALHPVQDAMVRHHGSQCGFCTPGFVMSLFALYHQSATPDRATVNDWISGNLCRCTGYLPIVAAALAACRGRPSDSYVRRGRETAARLAALASPGDIFIGDDQRFLAVPASPDSLAELCERYSDAVLVAGATDVGLWITKQLRDLPRIIFLHRAGLDTIAEDGDRLAIGATASYAAAAPHLAALDPDLGGLLRRLGSRQVREVGTVGGNIANGSPIGDMPPALIALGAEIELRRGSAIRTLPLEAFFLGYGRQDRRPGEFLVRILIPKPARHAAFRCFKIAKRFDQDISAVMGAFLLTLAGRQVSSARIAFGGLAAVPRRASRAEAAIAGASLDDRTSWQPALEAIAADFQPIDDLRATATYRLQAARALLEKAMREIAGAATRTTRVFGSREAPIGRVA